MTLLTQCAAQEVRASAGFHANQSHPQVRREAQQLPREFLPDHYLASHVETNKVKDCLAQIDADCVDFHGPPPVLTSYSPEGQEAADHTN